MDLLDRKYLALKTVSLVVSVMSRFMPTILIFMNFNTRAALNVGKYTHHTYIYIFSISTLAFLYCYSRQPYVNIADVIIKELSD